MRMEDKKIDELIWVFRGYSDKRDDKVSTVPRKYKVDYKQGEDMYLREKSRL